MVTKLHMLRNTDSYSQQIHSVVTKILDNEVTYLKNRNLFIKTAK